MLDQPRYCQSFFLSYLSTSVPPTPFQRVSLRPFVQIPNSSCPLPNYYIRAHKNKHPRLRQWACFGLFLPKTNHPLHNDMASTWLCSNLITISYQLRAVNRLVIQLIPKQIPADHIRLSNRLVVFG